VKPKDKPLLKYKFSSHANTAYGRYMVRPNQKPVEPFVIDKVRQKSHVYEENPDSPIKSHQFTTAYKETYTP
jgi:hypothetical protein